MAEYCVKSGRIQPKSEWLAAMILHLLHWPPNSHDLNPVDYKISGVMQEKVYKTKVHDVGELHRRITKAWYEFD